MTPHRWRGLNGHGFLAPGENKPLALNLYIHQIVAVWVIGQEKPPPHRCLWSKAFLSLIESNWIQWHVPSQMRLKCEVFFSAWNCAAKWRRKSTVEEKYQSCPLRPAADVPLYIPRSEGIVHGGETSHWGKGFKLVCRCIYVGIRTLTPAQRPDLQTWPAVC